VGGDPGQVHTAGAALDEEQHVQAAQEHSVDMKEVRSLWGPITRSGAAGGVFRGEIIPE
jgi:hypothetical protein